MDIDKMRFEHLMVERDFACAASTLRCVFWNIGQWKDIWCPVDTVYVNYDDGCHQEFEMRVQWSGRQQHVRTVRLLTEAGDILFFCPTPPFNLVYQSGLWAFQDCANGCRVRAERWFIPRMQKNQEMDRFKNEFKQRLIELLLRISDSVVE